MKIPSSSYLHRSAGAFLVGALLLALSGCDDHFVGGGAEPEKKFEGIRVTFEDGRQGGTFGDASDDWQPIPQAGAMIAPAAPNPIIISSDTVEEQMHTAIAFDLAQRESLRLWVESSPGALDMEIFDGAMEPGRHELLVDFMGKNAGIYRVYMSIRREGGDFTTYGDIMVKQ